MIQGRTARRIGESFAAVAVNNAATAIIPSGKCVVVVRRGVRAACDIRDTVSVVSVGRRVVVHRRQHGAAHQCRCATAVLDHNRREVSINIASHMSAHVVCLNRISSAAIRNRRRSVETHIMTHTDAPQPIVQTNTHAVLQCIQKLRVAKLLRAGHVNTNRVAARLYDSVAQRRTYIQGVVGLNSAADVCRPRCFTAVKPVKQKTNLRLASSDGVRQ